MRVEPRSTADLLPAPRRENFLYTYTHTLAQDGDAEGLSLNYLGALSECITHIHLPPAARIFLCRLRAARL
jgi:hypothetical protein